MRIDFVEEGGIAYLPGLRKPVTIDVEQLEPGERAGLEKLVEDVGFFELPENIGHPAPGAADYQHFRLTIEDKGRHHSVRILVPVDPKLQPLVAAVQRLVKAQRAAARARASAPRDAVEDKR